MSPGDADRDRLSWEPVFPNAPMRETRTAELLRTALIEIVGERGAENATLEAVLERAGVSRAAFDDEYENVEELFVDVWVHVVRDFIVRTDAAFERGGDDWRECLRYQAWDFLRFMQEDLNRARFLVWMTFADEMVQANRDIAMNRMIDYLHLGRFESEEAAGVPRASAEALVGAIWNGIAANIQDP